MEKQVFGFIGRPGAGKDSAIVMIRELLEHHHENMPMFQFSDPINQCLDILHQPRNRPNQQKFSTLMREMFGQDLLANVLYARVMESESHIVGVGGIRRPKDIEQLRKIPGFHLIFVTADQRVRWTRVRKRNDRPGDGDMSYEEFCKQNMAETEQLIDVLGTEAEFTIDNTPDGLEHLQRQVTDILTKLRLA